MSKAAQHLPEPTADSPVNVERRNEETTLNTTVGWKALDSIGSMP